MTEFSSTCRSIPVSIPSNRILFHNSCDLFCGAPCVMLAVVVWRSKSRSDLLDVVNIGFVYYIFINNLILVLYIAVA